VKLLILDSASIFLQVKKQRKCFRASEKHQKGWPALKKGRFMSTPPSCRCCESRGSLSRGSLSRGSLWNGLFLVLGDSFGLDGKFIPFTYGLWTKSPMSATPPTTWNEWVAPFQPPSLWMLSGFFSYFLTHRRFPLMGEKYNKPRAKPGRNIFLIFYNSNQTH